MSRDIISGCVVRAEIQREQDRTRSHLRPYKLPEGGETMVRLDECCCKDRRGPEHGVCGNCGGAIP